MASYANLKAAIQQVIRTNGNQEITGSLLQQSLLAMISALGDGYQFIGIATPETNPGTPDQQVFYIGSAGTYPNFGPAVIPDGNLAVFYYDTNWHYGSVAFPLGDGSVSTSKIQDGAVTEPKLATSLVNKLFSTGYKFAGIATPSTTPGTPNQNVFYIGGPGTYRNFGETHVVDNGLLGFFEYNNGWTFETVQVGDTNTVKYVSQILTESQKQQARTNIDAASKEQVSQLDFKLIELTGFGTMGTEGGVTAVGDVYYNTNTKLLRRLASGTPSTGNYETVPYYNGAIYTCNGYLYIWDGTNLVSKEKEIEQKMLSADDYSLADVSGNWPRPKNYIQDGLVFFLDGKDFVAGQAWVDKIGNVAFTMIDCTKDGNGVRFNGTSSHGSRNANLDFPNQSYTIELVYKLEKAVNAQADSQVIFNSGISGGFALGIAYNDQRGLRIFTNQVATSNANLAYEAPGVGTHRYSLNKDVAVVNESKLTTNAYAVGNWGAITDGSTIGSNFSATSWFFKGVIYAIRVYNRLLTESEMIANQFVDKNNYNLQ